MLPYWLLYAIPAVPAFLLGTKRRSWVIAAGIAVGLVFILAIGFRYQVGGDWFNYLRHYNRAIGTPLREIAISDPGYAFLNWVMARWHWGIYGVNTACGAIFMIGLLVYCRQLPAPWLGFAVAVPYLIVVMAMGYTRQSVALGFFFLALAAIERGQFLQYLLWVALGATFHKSAVLLVPLGVFLYGKGWFLRSVAVVAAAYGLWDLLLADHQERLWAEYVDKQMESQGAKIRVFMNLVPSLLLLLYAKKSKRLFPAYGIWFWLSVASLLSVVLVNFATTAVDRFSLYFTPLQVAVFARLPVLLRGQIKPQLVRFGVVAGYAAVLYVWLNYAIHARYWLPYRNLLFQ